MYIYIYVYIFIFICIHIYVYCSHRDLVIGMALWLHKQTLLEAFKNQQPKNVKKSPKNCRNLLSVMLHVKSN